MLAPAVANALAAAGGRRLRKLPFAPMARHEPARQSSADPGAAHRRAADQPRHARRARNQSGAALPRPVPQRHARDRAAARSRGSRSCTASSFAPGHESRRALTSRCGPNRARRWPRSPPPGRCAGRAARAGRDRRSCDALRQSFDSRRPRAAQDERAASASSPPRSIRNIARRRRPARTMRSSPRIARCAGSPRCGRCRPITTTRSTSVRLKASLERQLAALDFVPDRLLLSFHGMPQRTLDTRRSLSLPMPEDRALLGEAHGGPDVDVAFQSRFGRAKWLEPATDKMLAAYPAQGVKRIAIAAPGFSADCLETLEELGIRGRDDFPRRRRRAFRAARLPQRQRRRDGHARRADPPRT